MSLTVLKSGFQATLQDLGRNGFTHLGISPAGAADSFSFRLGNLLVGNDENDAGLEMTLVGGTYRFNQNVLAVLTGSRFSATLDGTEFPFFKAVHVKKGQELDIGPSQDGARCFLTVKGGFHVPQVLGSRSTHLMTRLGGYEGRALKKGDQINFGDPSTSREPEKLEKIIEPDRSVLHVTKGLQYDRFESKNRDVFFRERFIVSQWSNRMGLRTEGPEIKAGITDEILTEGLPVGAVQVPGNGHPIISFVDHQTTGGYPKIANVIAADLCKVGQLKPGDKFKFQLVSVVEAEKLYFEQESFFQKFTHSNS